MPAKLTYVIYVDNVPNCTLDDYVGFWSRYVKLDKVNKPSQWFGYSFTTDGVSAHLRMKRLIKHPLSKIATKSARTHIQNKFFKHLSQDEQAIKDTMHFLHSTTLIERPIKICWKSTENY